MQIYHYLNFEVPEYRLTKSTKSGITANINLKKQNTRMTSNVYHSLEGKRHLSLVKPDKMNQSEPKQTKLAKQKLDGNVMDSNICVTFDIPHHSQQLCSTFFLYRTQHKMPFCNNCAKQNRFNPFTPA